MRAKWLHHICRLGGPQRSARGQKSEMTMWPSCGQSGYITSTVLGVPNAQRRVINLKWRSGPHVWKVALAPPPSWGSTTVSAGTTIRHGYVVRMWSKWLHYRYRLGGPQRTAERQRSEMATWPTCGHSGYITPTVLGVPNVQRGDKNLKWLSGSHVGKLATSHLPLCSLQCLARGRKLEMGK